MYQEVDIWEGPKQMMGVGAALVYKFSAGLRCADLGLNLLRSVLHNMCCGAASYTGSYSFLGPLVRFEMGLSFTHQSWTLVSSSPLCFLSQ